MDALAPVPDSLPAASAKKLERCAVAIDRAKAKGVEVIFEVGKQLQVAHAELANSGNGTFGKWCERRCGITPRTARNYMNVVEAFVQHESKEWERLSHSFTAEALYYLSRDTTVEDAVTDALKLAESGERITLAKAKELAAEYTIDSEPSEGDEDEEGEDEEDGDDDQPEEWQPADCIFALRAELRKWTNKCPAGDLPYIAEALRDLANQVENKINGSR